MLSFKKQGRNNKLNAGGQLRKDRDSTEKYAALNNEA